MKSLGIDIVSIKRIENIYKKFGNNFLKKILNPYEMKEIEKIKNKKRKIEKIAGIFAAKEAIIKCLNKKIYLNEITISYTKNGKPYCKINNRNIIISISHEKSFAVAVALIE